MKCLTGTEIINWGLSNSTDIIRHTIRFQTLMMLKDGQLVTTSSAVYSPWIQASCSIKSGLDCSLQCGDGYVTGDHGFCESRHDIHLAIEIPLPKATPERLHSIAMTLSCIARSRLSESVNWIHPDTIRHTHYAMASEFALVGVRLSCLTHQAPYNNLILSEIAQTVGKTLALAVDQDSWSPFYDLSNFDHMHLAYTSYNVSFSEESEFMIIGNHSYKRYQGKNFDNLRRTSSTPMFCGGQMSLAEDNFELFCFSDVGSYHELQEGLFALNNNACIRQYMGEFFENGCSNISYQRAIASLILIRYFLRLI